MLERAGEAIFFSGGKKQISCIPRLTVNACGAPTYVNRGYKIKKHLTALAVTTISAKVAAARVLKLAVAFGADANHVRHDRSRYRRLRAGC